MDVSFGKEQVCFADGGFPHFDDAREVFLIDWRDAFLRHIALHLTEKSWDCPCHGGRYSPTGKPLNGPPLNGLPPKKSLSFSYFVL
ncbi:Rieske 2Fe-2S domain-containing protein [Microcoleus sp. FACHB-68]|nr:Rieske 2Fe-2S domain-containing protein [Microcoleus sp. FACHB-68]